MRISRQAMLDNHSRLVERNAVYCRCGYDVEQHLLTDIEGWDIVTVFWLAAGNM